MRGYVLLVFLLLGGLVSCDVKNHRDSSLSIRISSDTKYSRTEGRARPMVILENSRFKAVVATREGGTCGIESGIIEYIQKSTGTNQIAAVVDANYMRGPLYAAELTHTDGDCMRVLLSFEDLPDKNPDAAETNNAARLAYTIFPHSPVLKIEYLERLPVPDPIVDLGAPGGVRKIGGGFCDQAETRVYGQEKFHEPVCHPATYWTSVGDDPRLQWPAGPPDGGPLQYKNHLIVAVACKTSGEGYGRVVPIHETGVRGGARHVKLLWNTGIEFYAKPWTDAQYGTSDEEQTYNLPFTSFLFCFDAGLENAMEMGQAIADGDMLNKKQDK